MTTKKRTTKAPTDVEVVPSNIKFTKSPDYELYYSNWVQVGFTPYDISIMVGIAEPQGGADYSVLQQARVIFNPTEALMVAQMLAQAVKNHEASFGKIVMPRINETEVN